MFCINVKSVQKTAGMANLVTSISFWEKGELIDDGSFDYSSISCSSVSALVRNFLNSSSLSIFIKKDFNNIIQLETKI